MWMSHGTWHQLYSKLRASGCQVPWLMNESYYSYECDSWMSYITHMNEALIAHTDGVTWYIWMRHVTHMNESCHTCEWVMSRIWLIHDTWHELYSNFTCINKSRTPSEWSSWLINTESSTRNCDKQLEYFHNQHATHVNATHELTCHSHDTIHSWHMTRLIRDMSSTQTQDNQLEYRVASIHRMP